MKRIIFEKYVDKVCSIYGITREKLFIRSRVAHVNEPRYLLYYLCLNRGMRMCELMDLLEQNGLKVFNTSIYHGLKMVDKMRLMDRDMRDMLNEIELTTSIV
jgi:hypothetical protein